MASTLPRSVAIPDSARGIVAVAALDDLVVDADRPTVDAQIALVTAAPGPAFLLWGSDTTCAAYNRHFRASAALKASALGKPLFKSLPELERAWKPKLDLAYAGAAAALDGAAFAPLQDGAQAEHLVGWLVPIAGRTSARGVLGLFMDAGAMVEPARRLVGAVAQDLREPLVGIQVVSERLARLPKPTRERCAEDMDRVLDLAKHMDRVLDEMGAFGRRTTSGGARLSPRPGDLGAIVRAACARIDQRAAARSSAETGTGAQAGKLRAIRVTAGEVYGAWDDEAISRILTSLVASARQHGEVVSVELTTAREGALLTVKDDGPGLVGEDAEQLFEPWKRGTPAAERRRRGVGLGLYLARELVQAHGGKIAPERPLAGTGGFVMRVTLPIVSGSPQSGSGPASGGGRARGSRAEG